MFSSADNEEQNNDDIGLLSAQLVDDQPTNINNMYGERNLNKSLERYNILIFKLCMMIFKMKVCPFTLSCSKANLY